MIVFLSPKILRTNQDHLNLLNAKAAERLNFIKQRGGKDPYGGTMDKILQRGSNSAQPRNENNNTDTEELPEIEVE